MIVLKSMDAQPQFDDVDGFAHVFDSSELEDEWKIRLSRELGVAARERAKHDGITLTELTRKALECDDLNETTDTVRPGRRPKNTDGREQLGDEWKIKLPYAIGKMARERRRITARPYTGTNDKFARAACDQRISTSTGY